MIPPYPHKQKIRDERRAPGEEYVILLAGALLGLYVAMLFYGL